MLNWRFSTPVAISLRRCAGKMLKNVMPACIRLKIRPSMVWLSQERRWKSSSLKMLIIGKSFAKSKTGPKSMSGKQLTPVGLLKPPFIMTLAFKSGALIKSCLEFFGQTRLKARVLWRPALKISRHRSPGIRNRWSTKRICQRICKSY